jgi:short-subunit dehydrogenase
MRKSLLFSIKIMPKTVLVSGASSGIGLAIAQRLHEEGYKVWGLSRTAPKVPYAFSYQLCDVTDEHQVASAVENVVRQAGSLDILINCAGMGISGAVESTDPQDIKKMFDVNLMGTFHLTHASIPYLRKQKGSKIINVGSVAGILYIPFQTYYSVTKAGIQAFTAALANELRPLGVQVGAVLPGDTQTNFTANRLKGTETENGVYGDRIRRSVERMEQDEQHGKSPDTVAKAVVRLLQRRHLPLNTVIGVSYRVFVFLNRLLPARFVNWIIYQMYGK